MEQEAGSQPGFLAGLRANLWLLGTVVLVFVLYRPTTVALRELWEDTGITTYTHGYLILAVSLWLLARTKVAGPAPVLSPVLQTALVVALALSSAGWLIAVHAGLQQVHEMLLPVIAGLAIAAAFGLRAGRAALFPLAFLYFAMPLWDAVNDELQSLSSVMVGVLVRIVGIPAWLEGNFVHIPGGTFEIAGGCSGLHYFIVGTAVAALYGETQRDTWPMRAAILGIGMLLALLTNWIRILIIIAIGHFAGMSHPWVASHYNLGWVVFAVAMVVFFLIVRRLPARGDAATNQGMRGPMRPAPASLAGVAVALLLGPMLLLARGALPPDPASLAAFPVMQGAIAGGSTSWRPAFPGADRMELMTVPAGGGAMDVLSVVYRTQSQGAELVGYGVDLVGSGQELLAATTVDVGGQHWRELVVQDRSGGRGLIWFVYLIDGRPFVSGLPAQLWYGVNAVFGRPLSGLLALRVTCDPGDCEDARRVLEGFAAGQAGALLERIATASG